MSVERFVDSAVVSWSTDKPTTGSVAWGTSSAYGSGPVLSSTAATSHSVTLSGLDPATVYHYQITATDTSGNTVVTPDATFTTLTETSSALASDDFNACSVDGSVWTFVDPIGDGSVSVNGTQLALSVPAGIAHDVWSGGNMAPRLMQPVGDTDFEVEVKFESPVTEKFEMQGLIVQQDLDDFLRLDFYGDGGQTRVFAARVVGGSPTALANVTVPAAATPLFMRVTRSGDTWTLSSSLDGSAWTTVTSFVHALAVSEVGPFAGNSGSSPPEHTALIDYVFDTNAPIMPEDPDTPSCADESVDLAPPSESGDQVAEWALDESSGSTAADAIGSNDFALSGNSSWMPGLDGDGHLTFDGDSGYGAIADGDLAGRLPSKSGDTLEDFSLTAWIRLGSVAQRNPILSKQGTSEPGDSRGFLFATGEGEEAGRLQFEAYRDESTRTSVVGSSTLTSGANAQWHHVAVTYDFVVDGQSMVRLYVDGYEVAANLSAVGPVKGNPQPLELGRYFWSNDYARYFDGDMDDVRVYDRALSEVDITELVAMKPARPTASFSASTQTGGAPWIVSFDATSSSGDGAIVSYDWDFGDGSTGSGAVIDHTFATDGEYVVSLSVRDDQLQTAITTATINLPTELLAFEVDRLVTLSDRGFPRDDPPNASANGDWTTPIDYAGGQLYFRAEIKDGGQPVPKSMQLQFCVWQDNLTKETCGSRMTINGNPGEVIEWSNAISSMWKKDNVPTDWGRERQRYGIAIKNTSGRPVSDFNGWNWSGEDPDEWYPLDLRFTVVAVPAGETFGGWGANID